MVSTHPTPPVFKWPLRARSAGGSGRRWRRGRVRSRRRSRPRSGACIGGAFRTGTQGMAAGSQAGPPRHSYCGGNAVGDGGVRQECRKGDTEELCDSEQLVDSERDRSPQSLRDLGLRDPEMGSHRGLLDASPRHLGANVGTYLSRPRIGHTEFLAHKATPMQAPKLVSVLATIAAVHTIR